jgi:hypothetical protein
MPTQPSFALKLERARVHLDALYDKVGAWIDREPYRVVDEPDPEPPLEPIPDGFLVRRFRIDRAAEMPAEFSLLIGDCLFNLRASLDHLALALARAHSARTGTVMTNDQVGSSEFPIFYDRPMKPNEEQRKIGCVDPAACAAIRLMQPYQRGDGYTSDPLWQIHEMNRIDKHRALTVCAAESNMDGTSKIGIWHDRYATFAYGRASNCFDLRLNAVLFRWAGAGPWPGLDMRMKPHIAPEIVFGDGGPAAREPVFPTLRALCDYVGNVVVPALAKFL